MRIKTCLARLCLSLMGALALTACVGEPVQDSDVKDSGTYDSGTDIEAVSKAALLSAACANCHAVSGDGMPDISTLSASNMQQALMRYKAETDGTTVMHRVMRGYSDTDIGLIAEMLGAQPTREAKP